MQSIPRQALLLHQFTAPPRDKRPSMEAIYISVASPVGRAVATNGTALALLEWVDKGESGRVAIGATSAQVVLKAWPLARDAEQETRYQCREDGGLVTLDIDDKAAVSVPSDLLIWPSFDKVIPERRDVVPVSEARLDPTKIGRLGTYLGQSAIGYAAELVGRGKHDGGPLVFFAGDDEMRLTYVVMPMRDKIDADDDASGEPRGDG
jgi:hypothetical protein